MYDICPECTEPYCIDAMMKPYDIFSVACGGDVIVEYTCAKCSKNIKVSVSGEIPKIASSCITPCFH